MTGYLIQCLLFIHWDLNPVLFDFGMIAVRWYGLLFALGFILSYQILLQHFNREIISRALLDTLTIYVVIGAVVGARLGHCLFYDFNYYSDHVAEIFLPVKFEPRFEFVGCQGLASHGGALGILVALIFFCVRQKVPFFWVLDKLALVVPLAGCCIRLGNLMNSEILGKPSDVSWAFIFVREDQIPRHPAQLYEAVAYLFIFFVIHLLNTKIKRQPGFLFATFITLLFSARFLLEFLKEIQSDFEKDMVLNMGQLLSVPFILLGLWLALTRLNVPTVRKEFSD